MDDGQARVEEHAAPLIFGESALVAGVTQPLEGVQITRRSLVFRRKVVFHQQASAGLEHASAFLYEAEAVGEMMWSDTAGRQVKYVTGEGEVFGVTSGEHDVGNSLTHDKFTSGIQHGRRQIAGNHTGNVRRKLERGVAATGGNVQRQPIRLRLRQLKQALQISPFRVGWAGDVTLRILSEAGLSLVLYIVARWHLCSCDCKLFLVYTIQATRTAPCIQVILLYRMHMVDMN